MFTEQEQKRLDELKEKKRKAQQEERNKKKRDDRYCKSLFGLSVQEINDKLAEEKPDKMLYFNEYIELKGMVERLMTCVGYSFSDFEAYVKYRERKKSEQENKEDGHY